MTTKRTSILDDPTIYKALPASAIKRGVVRFPDNHVYDVTAISIGDVMRLDRLQQANASDEDTLPIYLEIVTRVTTAPADVIALLSAEQIGHLLTMSRFGVDVVATALAAQDAPTGRSSRAPRKTRSERAP